MTLLRRTKKKRNYWKIAFFALIAINLFVMIASLIPSRTKHQVSTTQILEQGENWMEVTLSKTEIQNILEIVTKKNQIENPSFPNFVMNDSVIQITGDATALGVTVPYKMTTVPYVTEEGAIQLKIQSVQLRGFSLPVFLALGRLQQMEFPEWFQLNTENQYFLLNLSGLHEGNTIKAKKINLKTNEFIFSISISNDNIVEYLQ
ncbi:DUF2140 family protein [uncultured Granulicatella sp.]|uniref:DUF2140 family protein n=1 Tax=uncultured Granulicatella sp. TaxID=316089 RepID=UPI0028F015CB|nr:DUF2140 family protein [uncultured Granulicatella sp.]